MCVNRGRHYGKVLNLKYFWICLKKMTPILENPSVLQQHRQNSAADFLVTYFNFAYFLYCSPFRLIKCDHNRFMCTRWWPHTLIFGILTSLSSLWMIYWLRTCLPANQKNPGMHLDMMKVIASQISKCVLLKTFIFYQSEYCKLINAINDMEIAHEETSSNRRLSTRKIWSYLICILYTSAAILSFIHLQKYKVSKSENQNSEFYAAKWWESIVSGGRNIFILPSTANMTVLPFSNVDIIIGCLSALGLLHR